MKKKILFLFSFILTLIFITACSSTDKGPVGTSIKDQDIIETAYHQLPSKDKERISGTYKKGKCTKVILKEGMGSGIDKAYIDKEVYSIVFPTKSNAVPNNMIVFFSTDSIQFIGYGMVD